MVERVENQEQVVVNDNGKIGTIVSSCGKVNFMYKILTDDNITVYARRDDFTRLNEKESNRND